MKQGATECGRYVAGFGKYKEHKADMHGRQMKLVPMLIEEDSFEEIAMDFTGALPE